MLLTLVFFFAIDIKQRKYRLYFFLELRMDHDHDHHHHHVNMVTKANMVMNHAQHLQQQTTSSPAHSGHGSHAKDMMMTVMHIKLT